MVHVSVHWKTNIKVLCLTVVLHLYSVQYNTLGCFRINLKNLVIHYALKLN